MTWFFRFDASRPPPPIPTHAHTKNGSLKRASSKESDGKRIFVALNKFIGMWNFQHLDKC